MITINISNLDTQNFQMNIPNNSSLRDIKNLLLENFGIETKNSSIFFQGHSLQDNFIINSQKIGSNPTFILFDHNLYPKKSYSDKPLDIFRMNSFNNPNKFRNMYIQPKRFSNSHRNSKNISRVMPPQMFGANQFHRIPLFNNNTIHMRRQRPLPRERELFPDVHLTEEDNAAITRLQATGAQRYYILQIYIACDRNEENARNILMNETMN